MTNKVTILTTCYGNPKVKSDQRACNHLMTVKNIQFEEIDAGLPENKDRRNELFTVSGVRGKFPQIFISSTEGGDKFIGMWEVVSVRRSH